MLRRDAGALRSVLIGFDHVVSGLVSSAVLATPGMVRITDDQLPVRLLLVALTATFLWPLLFEHLGLYQSQRRAEPLRLLAQVALFSVLRYARRHGRNYRHVLIVGSGPRAREARDEIARHPEWGLRVLGFADDCDAPIDSKLEGEPVFKLSALVGLFRDEVVDEVLVACPRSLLPHLSPVIGLCASVGVPVFLVSDLFGDLLPPPRAALFGQLQALSFAPVHHSQVMLLAKRALDIVVGGALLMAAAPVLVGAAAFIKLTSRGPVLFRQTRCGLHGRRFDMLKLRTMYEDAEERRHEVQHLNEMSGPVFKIRNDPRVTRVGRYLRRWSIDELPQLWNVLRGDMSLVGPRPPIPSEVAQYETAQRRRLSMRPGLTCLWQVSGRNEIDFDDWVKLDLHYIDSWSLILDLQVMARTVSSVLRGTGR